MIEASTVCPIQRMMPAAAKDVDERALELPRKNDEKAIRLPFRKFVGTVFLKTRLCFLFR